MDLARPYALIASPIDAEVLVVLRGTTRPLTGREVARLVRKGSQPAVNAALRRLREHGLVAAEEAGRAYLYMLNREHLAARAVEVLAGLREELETRMRAEIERWTIPPEHLSIFGSAARGEGGTTSDIDLFVVRPSNVGDEDSVWREQLSRLSELVQRWTGNHVGLAETSARDLPRLRRDQPLVVREIAQDAVTVVGAPARELLGLPS